MAKRILIGNRASGGYGVYVSQPGEDVTTTSNALLFDSRMATSLILHSYHQGYMAKSVTNTITHNLGYKPLFATRCI
mgnify:FL=1